MNWIGELYDLYDKNERFAGKMGPGQPVLLPLYHTTVAAQITVTIDEKGNFLYAETVPEEEKSTIIPVTDKSSSRTSARIRNRLRTWTAESPRCRARSCS